MLAVYIVDCELMNIGAVRYINDLTIGGLRASCCTSFELQQFGKITVKYNGMHFSVSIDILSAQKGAISVPQIY